MIVVISPSLTNFVSGNSNLPFMTLKVDTSGGGIRPDYALFVGQFLREIGIEVEVKVNEWGVFVGELIPVDYDIRFVHIQFQYNDPDPSHAFSTNGLLQFSNLNAQVPFVNESEDLLKTGLYMSDFTLRKSIYDIWQQLFMDKILPIYPLFSRHRYEIVWENTRGYNPNYGLIDNLPYMSFNGLHLGQESTDMFSIGGYSWNGLNPLISKDKSSGFMIQLLSEPLIQTNNSGFPTTTGLIENWVQLDDYHYEFQVRDGIFWNPSYNISERNSESTELFNAPLMKGLKGESSNGSNQRFTAKDAVFTLLCWANDMTREDSHLYEWIEKIWVDHVDDLVFYIAVDGDSETLKKEPFVPIFSRLGIACLPEFFLNSTSYEKSLTSGGIECTGLYSNIDYTPEWESFEESAFYCGKYMIDYFERRNVTVLQRNHNWYGVGAIDGQSGLQPFVETFKVKFHRDVEGVLQEFKQGTIDFCDITPFPHERKEMEQQSYIIHEGQLNSFDCMLFNLGRPFIGGEENSFWLSDIGSEEYTLACAVRKAICYAINRSEINQILYDNEYLIVDHPLPPLLSPWFNDDLIKYGFDLDKASEWLRAAGFYAAENESIFSYTFRSSLYILATCLLVCLETIYYNKRKLKSYGLQRRKYFVDYPTAVSSETYQNALNSDLKQDNKSDFLLNSYLR